ncbi:MAG: DMT family transporter [Bacteroidota bacterium]
MRLKVALSIALIVLFWASSFVAIKIGLEDISAMNLTLGRFIISSVTLGILAIIYRPARIQKKDRMRFILASLSGVVIYNIALNYGQQSVSVGSASFLINTVPMLTTLLSFLILKEPIRIQTAVGIFVSTVGIALITLSESVDFKLNTGILLVLGAALSQAVFFIVQKPLLTRYSPFTVISYSVWLGTLFLLPFSGDIMQIQSASAPTIVSLFYLGIIAGAVGYLVWAFVLSKMTASKAASFLYFVPVVSIILSFFLVGETPSALLIIGGAIAILGVYIINRKGPKA